MIYGISKSKDVLLSSIAEALNEDTKKAYTINRLSDNLVSDLTNENMVLHQELNTLKNNFNDAMGEISHLKYQLSEMLNLISNLQYSKNNI